MAGMGGDYTAKQNKQKMKTEIDPTALYWAHLNNLEMRIPGQAVIDIAQPGQNDAAVAFHTPAIRRMAEELHPSGPWEPTAERVREELRETGAWSDRKLEDEEENWRRIVWIAAWNIAEEEAPDCSDPVTVEI